MRHRHTWDRGNALVCYCGLTNGLDAEISKVRQDLLTEMVDDAEVALLQATGIPVTVASLSRWGGWS